MRKVYVGILLGLWLGNMEAQSFVWAKKGGLWAYDYGYGITTDNSGNVYVAGKYEQNANFSGTVLPCQGNHDIFLAQYSSSGNLNWIRTAGGYTGDYATSVACDGNYVYVAGEIEGKNATIKFVGSPITLQCNNSNDIFLAKYTLSGTLLWARRAGSPYYEKALGITYDYAGNVYICGLFNNSATFGGTTTISGYGKNDIFVAKYDASGNFLWVRKAGSAGRDEAKSIKCDAAGNVYICGLYKDGCVFGSQTLSSPNGYFNAFVAKYSPGGSLLWVKKGGGNYDDVGWSLTLDNAGMVYVAGEFNATATFSGKTLYTSGSADAMVLCYDASGNIQWAKKAGGNAVDRARGIGFAGNKLYITGQFGNTAAFGSMYKTAADNSDIFIACMSTSGSFLWVSAAGGAKDAYEELGYESGNAVCADAAGNVYATGSMLNGATFGSTSLSPYTRTDVFVTKLRSSSVEREPSDSTGTDSISREQELYGMLPGTAETTVPEEMVAADGRSEAAVTGFRVYPNPGTGIFSLELDLGATEMIELSVFNSSGQVVDYRSLAYAPLLQVDLSGREKGIYFIEIKTGEAVLKKKIVLQ
ncbi:MAG: SBBP repeat-containing protein [Bacteroidota bacterium]